MLTRSSVRSMSLAAGLVGSLCLGSVAHAASLTFVKLTDLAGGSPAATAVYRADLSAFAGTTLESLTIEDLSGGVGGFPGQFSGFDLDAVILSSVLITSATDVGSLTPAALIDFDSTVMVQGTQRAPTDAALFGTTSGQVDHSVATLGVFDGDATTAIPGAFGYVSMGDLGTLSFNLAAPLLLTSTPVYLYIGDVGDNGEVAGASITLSEQPVVPGVPEPTSLMLMGLGLAGVASARRARRSRI